MQTLEGRDGVVSSVAFSHDSTRLASASASFDGTVKIWDASSGACVQKLEGHNGGVLSVAFSHDSTQLVSASGDGTVYGAWGTGHETRGCRYWVNRTIEVGQAVDGRSGEERTLGRATLE